MPSSSDDQYDRRLRLVRFLRVAGAQASSARREDPDSHVAPLGGLTIPTVGYAEREALHGHLAKLSRRGDAGRDRLRSYLDWRYRAAFHRAEEAVLMGEAELRDRLDVFAARLERLQTTRRESDSKLRRNQNFTGPHGGG